MRKLILMAAPLLILIGIPLLALELTTVSYRYRLTVAVETGGQVHSGSSVIEVRFSFNPEWAPPSVGTYNVSVAGQAVLIDLGARGALVAALGGNPYDRSVVNASLLASCALLPASWRNPADSPTTPKNQRAISQMKGPANLGPGCMPAFYWFFNPADLATVKEVKPAEFTSVIGDATRLVSAQVEITHDPVVIDIDKKLPAYALLRGPPNNGNDYIAPGGLVLGWRQFISKGNE
jgi:hypothetical protein